MFKKQNPKPLQAGLLAGLLEVIYIALLVGLGTCVTANFHAKFIDNQTLGSVLFLLVFVFSAAVSALIVLGYPLHLLLIEKKTHEAIKTLIYTLVTLLVIGILVFALLIV